jgi:hypothetical protein
MINENTNIVSNLRQCLIIVAFLFLIPFTGVAQKVVIFENDIIYQYFPINTDGDLISVTSPEKGADGVSGTAVYKAGEQVIIQLTGDTNYDLKANSSRLIFKFANESRGYCISHDFDMVFDLERSNPDKLIVTQCYIVNQVFTYNERTFCNGERLIEPTTNIPLNAIELSSAPGIVFDENWNILPHKSQSGYYDVLIESDYCIEYGQQSIPIIISPVESRDMQENIQICSSAETSLNEITGYTVYSIDEGISGEILNGITESGDYLIQSSSSLCAFVDTVSVNLVEITDIELVVTPGCSQAQLSIESFGGDIAYQSWWNGATTPTTNVSKSDTAWVLAVDQNNCPVYDTLAVVFEPFGVESIEYEVVDASCWEEGRVDLLSVSINQGEGRLSTMLRNTSNSQLIDDFYEVPEGEYTLKVSDERNCTAFSEQKILVKQTCLDEYPVFTPDNDGVEDEYFIPHTGSIKIYDRNGTLLRTLFTPNYWDGRDASGNLMPMGNYVMVTDDGNAVNITIIR